MDTVLKIEGMMCAHCAMRVQKALESVDGVERVVISLDEGIATISADDADKNQMVEAVVDAGYKVREISDVA